VRKWTIVAALFLALPPVDARAQWNLEAFSGYARTFQITSINGGLEFGAGVFYSFPGLTVGLEASSYNLGDNSDTQEFRSLFPPFDSLTVRSEEARSGYRVVAILQKRVNQWSFRGGLGYYGHTMERASQVWDSAGAVSQPRTVTKDDFRGPGALLGVGFNLLRLNNRMRLRLQLDSHFMFVKPSSGTGGYGFLHYASGGIRLAVGF
jgi:hypothetical protein